MSNPEYPPAYFKFPSGFTFADQGTEREETARKLLYLLLFDPDIQWACDKMTEEAYEADMKERDRMENDGYFDTNSDELDADQDDGYDDPCYEIDLSECDNNQDE